jgi:uncharacterized protein (UPF0332 family)
MEARKELGRLPTTRREIQGLLSAARKHLKDSKVAGLSHEAKLVHAYQAILVCAKALLRANGYRVTADMGEHALTLETLASTVGSDRGLIRYFQRLRKKRHDDLYAGTLHVSHQESAEAIGKADALLRAAASYLKVNFKDLTG